MPTMLEVALNYVALGFKVFPVGQDKKPLTKHGLKDAVQTQIGCKDFWGKNPNAGIAIVTDGLIVLDFDIAHNGLESKARMEEEHETLPPTRIHLTGGGGFHYIYRNPNGTNVRNTVAMGGYEGIDVRANGGYIVMPPSLHPSGNRYEVSEDNPIAPAPGWLMELVKAPSLPDSTGDTGEKIPIGQNDQWLFKRACAYRGKGDSEDIIFEKLKIDAKRLQQKPNDPYTDKDFRRIAQSSAKFTPNPPEDIDSLFNSLETEQTEHFEPNAEQTEKQGKKLNGLKNTEQKTEQLKQSQNPTPRPSSSGDFPVEGGIIGGEWEGLGNVPPTPLLSPPTPPLTRTKVIWRIVDNWLALHKQERFDLDRICYQLDIKTRNDRQEVAKKLFYEVERKTLEKIDRIYRFIDTTTIDIDWVNAVQVPPLKIKWPYGIDDNTKFGFDGSVVISPGDIVVIAGLSNMGKTAMCLNILWNNMDNYPCTLMGNEYEAGKFKRRVSKMSWASPVREDGTPKFELIERYDNWKDIVRPNHINIIDWINLEDNFYKIGSVIEGIKSKLNDGIAIISLQKSENKALGLGGGFSEHLASLYMAVDFHRLTVRKAKEWYEFNPNGRMYGFKLINTETKFANIREVKKCYRCGGTGDLKMGECPICLGAGYIDV